eukprot:6465887-Alexandrium_andersonii.AAC.1
MALPAVVNSVWSVSMRVRACVRACSRQGTRLGTTAHPRAGVGAVRSGRVRGHGSASWDQCRRAASAALRA